ncbi:MAG: NAD-dependent deacylase [Chloroflexi bacterium]|nr:NAD-dependent deacylase [Chloroflexota bacterium]
MIGNDKKIVQAAELIKHSKHAIALTGAGVSTRSGIPDFRGTGSGLWTRIDPMVVASIWGFIEHPQGFYDWIKPLSKTMLAAKPNPAHYALAELETLGRLRALITQNIDDLHQRAGSQRVLEVHGHMRQATCIRCYYLADAKPFIEKFIADDAIPTCPRCGGAMKPNVTLFGEAPPVRVLYEAQQESEKCDVMIVAGSSLEVMPVADLPVVARRHGAQIVIINNSATPMDKQAAVVLREDVVIALPKIVERVKQ